MPKWIGNKPRLVVVNRKDMISAADARAWDAAYTLQATAAEAAQAAAATRSAARSAARAAAKAAEAGLDEEEAALLQQQQEHQQQREEELAPPRMPHQVFWTDSKTGAGVLVADGVGLLSWSARLPYSWLCLLAPHHARRRWRARAAACRAEAVGAHQREARQAWPDAAPGARVCDWVPQHWQVGAHQPAAGAARGRVGGAAGRHARTQVRLEGP